MLPLCAPRKRSQTGRFRDCRGAHRAGITGNPPGSPAVTRLGPARRIVDLAYRLRCRNAIRKGGRRLAQMVPVTRPLRWGRRLHLIRHPDGCECG
jgi:hypothetical protein